jgi:hypothetical protein
MNEIKGCSFFRCNINVLPEMPLMPAGMVRGAYLTGPELAFVRRHRLGLVEILDGVLVIQPEPPAEAQ